MSSLEVRPLTLSQANAAVEALHRHHKKAQGHRFSVGVYKNGRLVGAAIVGRPVARMTDPYQVAEVVRLVTDGTKNACSILYAASARACEALGFMRIQTFILDSEPGTSLRASGWIKDDIISDGGDWNRGGNSTHKNRRVDQPMGAKQRWSKTFKSI